MTFFLVTLFQNQNTPGKTLADFQDARDNDLSNINDEISAALDDLESAQKLLDEKHESVMIPLSLY